MKQGIIKIFFNFAKIISREEMKRLVKILTLGAVPMLFLGATSCSIFNQMFNKKEDSNQVKKEVVLPQDRESFLVKTDPKMYSPEEFSQGIIKGDWAIDSVFGQGAVGQKAPYIKFSLDEGKIYGNNGCNTINGQYVYNPADSTLSFHNIAITMMLCHEEGITDYLVNKALNDARTYELKDVEEGYLMYIYNEQGKKIMQLNHQNLDFLNGTWRVIEIDGEPIDIAKMKLVFDIDEHKVHGNTGCNVLNGSLETDMDVPNTFSFESMAVTMMMCPEMKYQTAMLVALEDACRAKPINKNRVQLLDDSGSAVMTLERTTDN